MPRPHAPRPYGPKLQAPEPARWWKTVNSPLVILLISSVILGGIASLLSLAGAEWKNTSAKRQQVAALLVELDVRILRIELQAEKWSRAGAFARKPALGWDGLPYDEACYGRYFGSAPSFTGMTRADADSFHPDAIKAVALGKEPYTPSEPAYANVSLFSILAKLDAVSQDHLSGANNVNWRGGRKERGSPEAAASAALDFEEPESACKALNDLMSLRAYQVCRTKTNVSWRSIVSGRQQPQCSAVRPFPYTAKPRSPELEEWQK